VLIEGHDSWVSRIHVDDLVSGLLAAWTKGGDGRVYNLVDDKPHRASEFANLAADLQGLPRPSWLELSEAVERLGEQRLRRKLANKRVRSLRLKEDLGVELMYPTYREGLPAAVSQE
jgi:nucleoside-diphosphate-sugar epimerase